MLVDKFKEIKEFFPEILADPWSQEILAIKVQQGLLYGTDNAIQTDNNAKQNAQTENYYLVDACLDMLIDGGFDLTTIQPATTDKWSVTLEASNGGASSGALGTSDPSDKCSECNIFSGNSLFFCFSVFSFQFFVFVLFYFILFYFICLFIIFDCFCTHRTSDNLFTF